MTAGIGDRYVMTAAINLERFRTAGVGPVFCGSAVRSGTEAETCRIT